MYETGSSQSGQTIEARRVTENGTRSGLKWSNRPGYSTNYGNVKTTGTAKKARSINLTEYARPVSYTHLQQEMLSFEIQKSLSKIRSKIR